jgi:hypothetical protein
MQQQQGKFMVLLKIRKLRRYILKKDHALNTILTTGTPNWYAWLEWLFPIVNASFLTPAILFTGESAAIGTYYLIAINAGLLLWHLKHTFENIYYDEGNRTRHVFQLLCILLAGVAGVALAWVSLPLIATPSTQLLIFYMVNVASSLANFSASLSGMFFPWIINQYRTIKAYVMRSTARVIKLPHSISEKLKKNDEYYLSRHGYTRDVEEQKPNSFVTILRNLGIGGFQKMSDQDILVSARAKATSLCYTYRMRKENKFSGTFRENKAIDQANELANEIVVDGKFEENSDGFKFFKKRVALHTGKLVYDLEILDKITKDMGENPDQKMQSERVKTISQYVKIDGLYTVVEMLNENPNINLYKKLKANVRFNGHPKNLLEQIQQMQAISEALLEERMLEKLIKLHDEEAYGVDEIHALLRKKLPDDFPKDLVKKALALLQERIQQRSKDRIRYCPLEEDQHGVICCGASQIQE